MEREKKLGRPTKPEYRKKRLRFGAIEDSFQMILEGMDEKDKKVAEHIYKKLRESIV